MPGGEAASGGWSAIAGALSGHLLAAGLVAGFVAVSAMFLIWWERKVSAHMQSRLGPMRVGWHGWLQSIADALKLLQKEDIVPARADRPVYWLAPLVVFVPAFLAFVCIPFGKTLIPADLNVGLLYILAITSVGVIGIFMAGWSSNNKYASLGAMRTVAQIVSYEVPLLLAVLGVVLMAGSLSMQSIVSAQTGAWFILLQPVGFLIYITAATAETNRTPFDIPEAESELVAGYHTEYSGMKFAFFFVAEYTNLFTVAALATTLFLGGWHGPLLPPVVWFLLKSYSVIFLLMWLRWTFPRVRVDQLMSLGWKVLMPLAFANLAVTALVILLFNGGTR
ncbi:MAG: NADH-quinone oxidoreductase subunit NuoH [Candidatus Sumerlaeia bacterium]|nr:NADH-quinone oxidoreductase subunit NuoH [Candidatus Sumerlaeia bacterium]